jgi:hypothetical protein
MAARSSLTSDKWVFIPDEEEGEEFIHHLQREQFACLLALLLLSLMVVGTSDGELSSVSIHKQEVQIVRCFAAAQKLILFISTMCAQ